MRPKAMRLKTLRTLVLLSAFATWHPTALFAQTSAPSAAQAAPTSDSAMVNLVRLLIEQGVLTPEKGSALMRQAEAEAVRARATAPQQQAQVDLPPPAAGAIRVPYVPETVRAQIREELKADVLAQARSEGWASPDTAAPDWTKRVRLFGDIRVRSQSNLYSGANSNLIPDFARINAIGPLPIFESDTFIPLLNSRVDRASRLQVRARLGIEAKIRKGIEVGLQLATGDDNSPISTNQSLGGGFAKRDIWLQNAFVKLKPTDWSEATLGRFPNPFFSTNLMFDEDLAFDGATANVDSGEWLGDDVKISLRGGAFPLDFGDANFPQNDVDKRAYPERWLFSGQVEVAADFGNDVSAKLGAAYHSFTNLQANLSQPCFLYRVQSQFRSGVICSTDNERATFLRKGNTVFPIRDIVLDVPAPALNEVRVSPQYVGLVFDYDVLNVNAEVHFPILDELGVTLTGDYVRNLAFKRSDLCRFGATFSEAYPPLNNVGPDGNGNICAQTNPSTFVGGGEGYLAKLAFGHRELKTRGQWQAEIGYRYLESDAVPDAFTDSDFHLGGTNAKGYFIGAKTALFEGLTIGARWLSANEISAEPFGIDVLQVDLEVKF
jgi:Putative porin